MNIETQGPAYAGADDAHVADPATEAPPGHDPAAETREEGEAGHAPAPPRRRSPQDRIDALTRARREAEREAAFWRAQATQGQGPSAEAPALAPAEPQPGAYPHGETDPGYIRDLARHEAQQAFRAEAEWREEQALVHAIEQSWEQRQADFARAMPDYFEVLDGDWACSQVMADAIKTSEEGARVAYHLALNPAEARRIADLHPLAQIREIGRLEARVGRPGGGSFPQPKTVSDAPQPHPTVRARNGAFAPAPDTDDFAAFEKLADAKLAGR